jgi:nicotinamidase-related amidase
MAYDLARTAFLVMDIQSGIVGRLENKDDYLTRVTLAVDRAHELLVRVIYVVVGFRPGVPELGEKNKMFQTLRDRVETSMISPEPLITPVGDDIVITKRRVSAFTGSDLETILRAHDIEHLVLCGVATSGVVLSTLREAADKDYRITVLSDLCADGDEEMERVLFEKIFPRQADVLTSDEWFKEISLIA